MCRGLRTTPSAVAILLVILSMVQEVVSSFVLFRFCSGVAGLLLSMLSMLLGLVAVVLASHVCIFVGLLLRCFAGMSMRSQLFLSHRHL